VAHKLGSNYMSGTPIRQDYLETVIKWISEGKIEDYMSKHQHDSNALELWEYFQSVILWVEQVFPKKYNKSRKKFMRGVDWGFLYNNYKDEELDSESIEKEIKNLMLDDDVTKKSGIYYYVLTRNEKHLNIRAFTDAMKQQVYERQNGKCAYCGDQFPLERMEADHITPWHEGGKTIAENCQLLCKEDNRKKSGK
jgi:hypothetical protein